MHSLMKSARHWLMSKHFICSDPVACGLHAPCRKRGHAYKRSQCDVAAGPAAIMGTRIHCIPALYILH